MKSNTLDAYYINKAAKADGVPEVHKFSCKYLKGPLKRTYLGLFIHCDAAISEAKKTHPDSVACNKCCPERTIK